MLPDGTMLGAYKVLRHLGTNSGFEVYEAEDQTLGRRVALKVLPPEAGRDPKLVARFQKEVRATATLNHTGIVSVFEVGESDGVHYYSMRLLTGGDLRRRIREGTSEPLAIVVLSETLGACVHAHGAGFVHRELRPENILFDEQGRAVITDLGMASAKAETSRTATGMGIGNPHYVSPEQARGQPIDARTDLYSLGVIFYEMLTGAHPYEADDPLATMFKHVSEPIPRLPQRLAHYQPIVDALMAKDPAQRPATAADALALLNEVSNAPTAATAAVRTTGSQSLPPSTPQTPAAPPPSPSPTAQSQATIRLGNLPAAETRAAEDVSAAPPASVPRATPVTPPSPTEAIKGGAEASQAISAAPRSARRPAFVAPAPTTPTGAPDHLKWFAGAAVVVLIAGLLLWGVWPQDAEDPAIAPQTASIGDDAAPAATAEPEAVVTVAPTMEPEPIVARTEVTPAPTPEPAATPEAASMPEPSAQAAIDPAAARRAQAEAARAKAEAERRRKQQAEERFRKAQEEAAQNPPPVANKAEQMAREIARCPRHVSELFPGWTFTYADMAAFPGTVRRPDGLLETPSLAFDFTEPQRWLVNANGCVIGSAD